MDKQDAVALGDQISKSYKKWETNRKKLDDLHQARHGFLGEMSASTMQHSPAMLKTLKEGVSLILQHDLVRQNLVEDGDERTVRNEHPTTEFAPAIFFEEGIKPYKLDHRSTLVLKMRAEADFSG